VGGILERTRQPARGCQWSQVSRKILVRPSPRLHGQTLVMTSLRPPPCRGPRRRICRLALLWTAGDMHGEAFASSINR